MLREHTSVNSGRLGSFRVEIALRQDALATGREVEVIAEPCATVDRHGDDVAGLRGPAVAIVAAFDNVTRVLATRRSTHVAAMDDEGLAAPAVRARAHPSLRNPASRGGQRRPRFAAISRAQWHVAVAEQDHCGGVFDEQVDEST